MRMNVLGRDSELYGYAGFKDMNQQGVVVQLVAAVGAYMLWDVEFSPLTLSSLLCPAGKSTGWFTKLASPHHAPRRRRATRFPHVQALGQLPSDSRK